MGIVGTVTDFLGINIESRLRKVLFIAVLLLIVVVALTFIDPIADGFVRMVMGSGSTWGIDPHDGLPLTIPEMMEYLGLVWGGLSPIMDTVKQSTMFGVFFVLGMGTSVIAILLGGNIDSPSSVTEPVSRAVSKLAKYFNDIKKDYE